MRRLYFNLGVKDQKSENEYENDDQKKYNHTDGYRNLSCAHIITVRDC